ncbi:MAG: type IV secretory system conjugative DNA transfer family protein [Pseudomonadota bacterium]|nr:type IV secretory system conjugative DNA transfer family protein [Pseudomonadota bacterium]
MPDRLGTAYWEEQPVVAQKYPFSEGKFWLGRAEGRSAIGYRDDRHICVVSGTRGGKGTSLIVNNLCFWPGSAVVVDPKGENATVTSARRGQGSEHCAGMGQAVHVLDPFNVAQVDECYRSCFNPLADLDPNHDETIDEASRLANAIVVIKDEKADPFWDEAARSMVRGIILHVLTAPEFNDDDRNLITVRGLILRGHWQLVETMREMGVYENNPPHELLWQAMERNPAFNGLVAGIGSRFRSMMATAAKTFEGVLQSTDLNTEFLDSPGMRRILAKSDFKLSELKTRPEGMTLYLSLPQRYMDTHYRWLRMMVALTTTEMEITRGQPATGHPVLMVLDEFAGLKRMSAIENAVAQIAGFGVKLFFVLQSLEQLKFTYKDNWETFLANAGVKVFFSIDDHFTRDYVSKLAGETEMIRELRSSNESQSENQSYAEGRSQSRTRSQSTTRGTSQSDTQGTSRSFTEGTSASQTSGTSQSVNQSETEGVNQSRSFSESFGTNESVGWSRGSSGSSSSGWGSGGYSSNSSSGYSSSSSGSQGSSHSTTDGVSTGTSSSTSRGRTDGTSRSNTRGTSASATVGSSNSHTSGTSQSETSGTSDTSGTSQTQTKGTSSSTGTGRSESVHRRPLIQPDEVGKFFARIDDKSHSFYPGLALVMVTGAAPLTVKRTHYFEDPQFIDCFSPHPDHRFLPAVPYSIEGIQPFIEKLEAARNGARLTIAQWFVEPGKVTIPGQLAATIEQVPPDNRTVHIPVPYAGKVSETAKLLSDGALFTVRNYSGQTSDIDPFEELRAACRALEKPAKTGMAERFRFKGRWWALPQIPLILMAVALVLARLAENGALLLAGAAAFIAWSVAVFRKNGFGHMLMKWAVFCGGFYIGGVALALLNGDGNSSLVAGLVLGLAVTLSKLPDQFAEKLAATRPARALSTFAARAKARYRVRS